MSRAASGTGLAQKSCKRPGSGFSIVMHGRLLAFAFLSPCPVLRPTRSAIRAGFVWKMQRRVGGLIALIKPLLRTERYDDILGVGEVQHGTRALVQKIRIEVARAQCSHPPFPFRKLLLGMGEAELGSFEVLFPLRIGLKPQLPLRCVPGEIPRNEEENQR